MWFSFSVIRACNFKYVAIEWQKPATYGDAAVTGYKVFVNGVVEAVLGVDQCTYSYTSGKWCHEYVFQVQVSTVSDKEAKLWSFSVKDTSLLSTLAIYETCYFYKTEGPKC